MRNATAQRALPVILFVLISAVAAPAAAATGSPGRPLMFGEAQGVRITLKHARCHDGETVYATRYRNEASRTRSVRVVLDPPRGELVERTVLLQPGELVVHRYRFRARQRAIASFWVPANRLVMVKLVAARRHCSV